MMDDRGVVAELFTFFLIVLLIAGLLYGMGWLLSSLGGPFDSPDLECDDVDLDDDRDLERLIMYSHEDNSLFGERHTEGSLTIYEDGSYEATGPLADTADLDLTYSTNGVYVFDNESTYIVVDLHEQSIKRGPADYEEKTYRDTRETYGIYETCEVTIA